MDNAGGPSRSDQLDLMLTYEQQAHARTKATLATAQAERDSAYETVKAVMVRVVPAISQAAIVGKTYDHFVVVGMVETLVANLRKAEAERDAALQRAEAAERGIHIQAAAVRVIDQKERAEYVATQTLDSEREMNATLTAEVERLTQRAEQAEHAAAFDLMQAKSRHEADVATIQRVMRERDEARGTREQAEAALAQAQAERDEAKALIAKLEGEKP